MDKNKIEKGALWASFQLSNGDWIDGEIYLSLYDEHHLGAQTLDDLLSRGSRFIPVKTKDRVLLLNIHHILQAKIDSNKQEDDLMRLGPKHSVTVKTILGEVVTGDIFISLPEGRQRVKDYANATAGFFRIFQAGDILYLNPRHILSMHD